jgi:hypothetical protein
MFLAHFSNTPISYWMEIPHEEVTYWYNEAVKTHNKLNKQPDSD